MVGAAESDMPLQVRDLSARVGRLKLFSDLNFNCPPGSLTWVQGTNGSGKTTLLRMVAGLVEPDAGDVLWYQQRAVANADFAANLVYLGHRHGINDDLTALEALMFLVRLHGLVCSVAQATAALANMGVQQQCHVAVRHLSQGQRKRVSLARLVLSASRRLWLLDEPLDALDPQGQFAVCELIRSQVNRGGMVLLTSHIPLAMDAVQVQHVQVRMPQALAGGTTC